MLNCFVEFVIGRNTNELCRGYSTLKTFSHPQVSVHLHEISSHPSFISAKNNDDCFVKLLRFLFNNVLWLVIHNRTKNIIYQLAGRNHLMYNGFLEISLKQEDTVYSTPRMNVN